MINPFKAIFCCICIASVFNEVMAQSKAKSLWYKQPAKDWNEALPLGNGKLGAMVFGGIKEELISLNEETLWTGGPVNPNPNPEAYKYLQPVREALLKDSINDAVKALKKMQGPNTQMYQPLGDIRIKQTFNGEAKNYTRTLDIKQAATATTFESNGVNYYREMFISAPDQVMVIKLHASKLNALNLEILLDHTLEHQEQFESDGSMVLKGKARITNDERRNPKPFIYTDSNQCYGMRFQFRVKSKLTDGQLAQTDSSLRINNATEVILYITAATSFNGIYKCPDKDGIDENKKAADRMAIVFPKNYTSLRTKHISDYQSYFNRLSLNLNGEKRTDLPTDERLVEYRKGKPDLGLEELYFNFGRYLLISCSRPGGVAANLQGIWNKEIRPSWRSNFTTNINLQMNYWPANPLNLGDLAEPLVNQIMYLAKNGTETAKNYYHMRGWAVHHNSDIWAQTNPVGEGNGDPKWANWSLGSPWLSQHLWEQYAFSGNKKFLRDTAYPLMKTAALFCLDWLVEKDGVLVTAPSTSPENVYLHPNGFKGTVTIASAMDMEIIWDLFTNVMEAAGILKTDADFVQLLKEKRARLHPLKIGRKGNLVEWFGDWEDEEPEHRHVSHLFGLHPGRQLSPLLDAKFAEACRKTLEGRGDGGTGWSKAWKINFWARLLDGNHAYKMYQELLKTSTLNNLFDTHPPFQIDGNFGAIAGIAEMLLQSHLNELHLLPAIPQNWQDGNVRGLIGRSGYEVDLWWKNGKISKVMLKCKNGGKSSIRTTEKPKLKNGKPLKANKSGNYFTHSFEAKPGQVIEFIF